MEILKSTILDYLKDEPIRVALFGSYATGDYNYASDIDIALIPEGKYSKYKISLLRDIIEDLNIPYKIDLVDFTYTSSVFRENALTNAIWWR